MLSQGDTMPHYMVFPIGDWSVDGHGVCAEFMIKSNKPLQEVREVHLSQNDFIGSIAEDYGQNYVPYSYLFDGLLEKEGATEESVQTYLAELFQTQELALYDFDEEISKYSSYTCPEEEEPTWVIDFPEQMIGIWIAILNWFDSDLKLEVVSEAMSQYYVKYKGYPYKSEGDIQFYGYDKQNRHLNTPGYGVWVDYDGGEFQQPT